MSSGKSKLSAKTGALTQKDLDSFLALHVTAATDVYLQQLAHEVRRSHAAEERVKTLELELLAADAALSRATESVNERDHVLTHCYSQISELNNEIDDLRLNLVRLKTDISFFDVWGQTYALVNFPLLSDVDSYDLDAIRLELAEDGSELQYPLGKWIDNFNDASIKSNEIIQLVCEELRNISRGLSALSRNRDGFKSNDG